jgi:hypothetical protein
MNFIMWPKWISVKDRLPSSDETVLFCVTLFEDEKRFLYYFGHYCPEKAHLNKNEHAKLFLDEDEIGHGATHWLPLPPNPKD